VAAQSTLRPCRGEGMRRDLAPLAAPNEKEEFQKICRPAQ